jgi:hypothetical protein
MDAMAVTLLVLRGDYQAVGEHCRHLSREELFGALGQAAILAAEGAVRKYGGGELAEHQLQQLMYTLATVDVEEAP